MSVEFIAEWQSNGGRWWIGGQMKGFSHSTVLTFGGSLPRVLVDA